MTKRRVLLLFLLLLALRISLAAGFHGNFDSESYLIVASATLSGENVYAATDRYNYSPIWALVVAGLWWVASPSIGLFVLLIGLLLIVADVASALLIYALARRRLGREEHDAWWAALLFFSNPVSILISCVHGQFDGISILFLLAAIYWAMGADFDRKPGRVAAMLSLSILLKHVTVFHPLLFSRRIRRPGLSDGALAVPYVIFCLSFLPFAGAWRQIVRNVFLYSSGIDRARARPGGLQAYVSAGTGVVFTILFLVAVAWVVRATRETELSRACLVLFLALLVFLPTYSVQYVVWPVALGALHPSLSLGLFTAAAAFWHSSESLDLNWPIRNAPHAAWLAALLWFVLEMRRASSEARAARS